MSVVHLQSSLYHERIQRGMAAGRELLHAAALDCRTVKAQGSTPLAQQLYAILLGDYVSFYLAMLNGVDPTPVEPIDHVKAQLAHAD